ncbi:endolytic transglycosylase MltG [Clostridium weizhouense]|uniref:Endolytic murein transglycosylase n=1 Tax=Clostridium weizhouense TaxID=2859781 RepID=A0ABS7AN45_9CLOT|nr:endolytic transglycosylase MltG [Clostridium weizhouense]MBW6409826.1 endolytic transglycosylase MltG [Clostridium weizhouense]
MIKFKSLKKTLFFIILTTLVLVLIIGFISYKKAINKPLKNNENVTIIEVRYGEGFYGVLDRLQREGKLTNKYFIKLNLMLNKPNIDLQEGIYQVNSNVDLNELISILNNQNDNKNLKKLTIPEGYDVDKIAKKVEEEGFCSKDDFLNAVKKYPLPDFIKKDEHKRYNLEGFLYPDTYLLKSDTNADFIVKAMLRRFTEVLDEIENDLSIDIKDDDIEKTITIASMIEKEARYDEDRTLISSVIYNRLNDNMKLQLDATVIYALGYHVDVVLNKHLAIESPYNTYKYNGLPVGAICNPGKESIKAALNPEKTDYLFYILQDNGYHYFSNNYEDFLKKKKELGY